MEPKYKIGDIVTIKKKREGKSGDYRYCFTDTMLRDYGGESYKIKSIFSADAHTEAQIPDDGYRYYLEGACFSWASSMFEDTTKGESTNIDAFISKKKCPVLDFTLY